MALFFAALILPAFLRANLWSLRSRVGIAVVLWASVMALIIYYYGWDDRAMIYVIVSCTAVVPGVVSGLKALCKSKEE